MSKSFGNVIDPMEMIEKYGPEPLKGYMLVYGPSQKDANFDEKDLRYFYNTFINTIGSNTI